MSDFERRRHISDVEEDEISLFDVLLVLAHQKRLITYVTLLFVVIAVIASLMITKVYQASTRILNPVQRPSFANLIEHQIGSLSDIVSLNVGGGNLYVSVLKSRNMEGRILDRFAPVNWRENLRASQGMKRLDIVKKYIGELSVVEEKNGTILIAVNYTDQQKVAEIANAYVEELRSMTDSFFVTEATQRRFYYEKELESARKALSVAENLLREFQEKTGVYMGEAQLTANIQNRINMRAQIAAKEIQLRSLLSYATKQNPEVVKLEREIKGLKEEIKRLEMNTGFDDPLNPMGGMPAARFEYLDKYRDWKFKEILYNTLLKMYETARLDESYTPIVIQVLDEAVSPEHRIKPKRKLMVIMAGMLGLFVSVFCAFIAEAWQRAAKHPEQCQKMHELKQALELKWVRRLFNRPPHTN
ncbi:GumC family protein [Aminobacterium mobile]|jgi:uncharacterized protein involved in exopolysaccharide biosynthesis